MPASVQYYLDKLLKLIKIGANSSNRVAPAANVDAEILFAAASNKRHIIYGVAWSYDGDPTGGNLVVREGGTPVFEIDITTSGPGFIPFNSGLAVNKNTAMQLVLSAGGVGISGKLNVLGHYEEEA